MQDHASFNYVQVGAEIPRRYGLALAYIPVFLSQKPSNKKLDHAACNIILSVQYAGVC